MIVDAVVQECVESLRSYVDIVIAEILKCLRGGGEHQVSVDKHHGNRKGRNRTDRFNDKPNSDG